MRHAPALPGIQHRIMRAEPHGHVVGVQDRDLGRAGQARAAHHPYIGVADRQNAGAAERGGAHWADAGGGPGIRAGRVVRQVRRQVRGHADRSDSGSAAAMRDAECLVQVQVAHVGADLGRAGQAHLRVHVGPIHIDLAAMRVDDLADVADAGLEHAMRAGVGHHQRCQLILILGSFGAEVGQVHVALPVAAGHHHAVAGHDGAGGVGAVGAAGDEADVPMALAPGLMVTADGEQAGILALAAGVRLQRDRGKARDGAQPVLQALDQRGVALGLVHGCERVDVGEPREGHRDHLRRRVQLHGAGAERDHAAVQRDVPVFQPLHVAQHLVLGVIRAEHRLRQHRGSAHEAGGQRRLSTPCPAQHRQQCFQLRPGHGLIERDGDALPVQPAQVEPSVQRTAHDAIRIRRIERHRVKERSMPQRPRHRACHQPRLQIDPARNPFQARRPVPDRIHPSHHRQQHLGGADVARRFLTPDVLLARLQRQAERRPASGVHTHAHQPPRHLPLVLVQGGEEPGMRTAEAHRHAEALGRAHDHIRAHLAGWREQHEAQQVRTDDHQRPRLVRGADLATQVPHLASCAGVLQHDGERGSDRRRIAGRHIHQRDAGRCRAGGQHRAGLGMHVGTDRQRVGLGAAQPVRHRHRLGRRRRFVQQRGVGDRQAGQVTDHGLEIEQRLEPALRDLGLIGRVGGIPAGVL